MTSLDAIAATISDADAVAATVLTDLAAATSGAVTSAAVTSITGTAEEVQAALDSTNLVSLDAVDVTISDDGAVDASVLTDLAAATGGVVTALNLTSITGTVSEFDALFGLEGAGVITGDASATIAIITDTSLVGATAFTALDGFAGPVDISAATSLTGSAALVELVLVTANATVAGSVTYRGSVAVTIDDDAYDLGVDETVDATTLSAIGGATSGVVTVTNAIAISGTAAEVTAALVTEDTLVVLDAAATVEISDGVSVTDLNAITDATDGVVTATVSNTAIADLAGLTGTGNALTITVATTILSASDLIAVNAATTLAVTATAVTRVNGSVEDALSLVSAVNGSEITGLSTARFVLSDTGSNTTEQILQITDFTSGRVTSFAETYVGSVEDFGSIDVADSFLGLISLQDLTTNSTFAIVLM